MNKQHHEVLKKIMIYSIISILFLSVMFLFSINAFCSDRDFEKEEKIGRKMADRIEKQYDLIDHSEHLEKVNWIVDHLKDLSGVDGIHYQIKIIDRGGPNAFAFPGGFIYLTTDLLDYIQSDDELAAVIAHEMGHVIHQHSIKQMQDNRKLRVVELFAILLTGDPAVGLLSELTSITLLNSYRREYEEEADLTALELLTQSPIYHPVALLTYFERVSSERLLKPEQNLGIFQTHPDTNERIKKVKKYLTDRGIEFDRRLTTNYIKVEGRLFHDQLPLKASIFVNDHEILSFTGQDEEMLYLKMMQTVSWIDHSLEIDLEPYEMTVFSNQKGGILRIGAEAVISLSDEEVSFLGLSADESLQEARKRISKVLWQLKLQMPSFL